MKYQVGRAGRVVVARFEDKEDVLSNLTGIAKKENIKAAVVYLVGGMRE
ncbi:MAG: DNA-binding protein, partial [Nitrospirae bacterium]|nr:DNA-binding protein [Nitrospirota bacterium]